MTAPLLQSTQRRGHACLLEKLGVSSGSRSTVQGLVLGFHGELGFAVDFSCCYSLWRWTRVASIAIHCDGAGENLLPAATLHHSAGEEGAGRDYVTRGARDGDGVLSSAAQCGVEARLDVTGDGNKVVAGLVCLVLQRQCAADNCQRYCGRCQPFEDGCVALDFCNMFVVGTFLMVNLRKPGVGRGRIEDGDDVKGKLASLTNFWH